MQDEALYQFRKAKLGDNTEIWKILQQAIERRRLEGSRQWQDGYPNKNSIQNDIDKQVGFVLTHNHKIVGYCAALMNDEPEYQKIIGTWLTTGNFVVIHRIAIDEQYLGQNLSSLIIKNVEEYAMKMNIFSVKIDTNFDNFAMIRIFEKRGYHYCGEVYFRGSARRAYEKILI